MIRAAVLVLGLAAACGAAPSAGRARGTDAVVVITSNVRDAQLYLDGRFVAPLDVLRGGVAIAPGSHRLELRHERYLSSYLELEVGRGERKQISLDMAAILP